MSALHERIARLLGWTVQETSTLSLASLRMIVQTSAPCPERDELVNEINRAIRTGRIAVGDYQ